MENQQQVINALKECSNLDEMLKLLQKHFVLDKPLMPMQKGTILFGLQSAIKMINPPLKK